MQNFTPFANDNQSLSIGELVVENQGEQVNLYGSMTLTVDKQSLATAKALQVILTQAVAYLENHHAETIDAALTVAKQQTNVSEVKNPFSPL